MRKEDRHFLLAVIFSTLFVTAYAATVFFGFCLFYYYPLEHSWSWNRQAGALTMGWYGRCGFAFIVAALTVLVVGLSLKVNSFRNKTLTAAQSKSIGMVVPVWIAFCMGYILYHELTHWGVF